MRRSALLCLAVFAAALLACSAGSDKPGAITPDPARDASPGLITTQPTVEALRPTIEPTSVTAPGSIGSVWPTPSMPLLHFEGDTFAFDYPRSWQIWSHSHINGYEVVILANIPVGPGRGGLPEGAIKIDLVSRPEFEPRAAEPWTDVQRLDVPGSPVDFFVMRGTEAYQTTWAIVGELLSDGRHYVVSVLMEIEEFTLEEVGPIIQSWRPLTR